jgi:hypothetical protein
MNLVDKRLDKATARCLLWVKRRHWIGDELCRLQPEKQTSLRIVFMSAATIGIGEGPFPTAY